LHTFFKYQVLPRLLLLKSWAKAKIKRMAAQMSKTAIAILSSVILIFVLSVSFFSSVRFFCLEHPGILLVVLAVAGEVVCDWNRKKNLRERLKKFFGILLVVGLLLEIAEAIKSDEKAESANLAAKQAEKDADDAKVLADSIGTTNAQLVASNLLLAASVETAESNNLVMRSNVVALEERWAPRVIEEYAPSVALKKFAGVNAVIICATCPDCASTAEKIKTILGFMLSNWNVEPVFPTAQEVDFGVRVSPWFTNQPSSEESSKVYDAAETLVDELNKGGIDASMDRRNTRGTTIKFNGVMIVVGAKPTPAESELIKAQNDLEKVGKEQMHLNPTQQEWWNLNQIEDEAEKRIRDAYSKMYKVPENKTGGIHLYDVHINQPPLP
jgi:hypothetical protein